MYLRKLLHLSDVCNFFPKFTVTCHDSCNLCQLKERHAKRWEKNAVTDTRLSTKYFSTQAKRVSFPSQEYPLSNFPTNIWTLDINAAIQSYRLFSTRECFRNQDCRFFQKGNAVKRRRSIFVQSTFPHSHSKYLCPINIFFSFIIIFFAFSSWFFCPRWCPSRVSHNTTKIALYSGNFNALLLRIIPHVFEEPHTTHTLHPVSDVFTPAA